MYYIIIAAIIASDQFIKKMVTDNMLINESRPVLSGFFKINYIQNSGAAFSIFSGNRVALIIIPAIFSVAGVWYLAAFSKKADPVLKWGIALITGGGAGNMIDRIVTGYVTDYLSFGSFPVFNFADICVTSGCGLILIYVLFKNKKESL